MLLLLNLASKLELPEHGGGRAAIILSGSPLFNGGAGSGESEIRRWLLEKDLVEAIVALPREIFFRTGIGTYLWILSNKKPLAREGKIQLIDATTLWTPIKNEGEKRRIINEDQRRRILDLYASGENGPLSLMLDHRKFGYRHVRVCRPLRMSLTIDADTILNLKSDKVWLKLMPDQQEIWETALRSHLGEKLQPSWIENFVEDVCKANPRLGKPNKAFVKALMNAFAYPDPEGQPMYDKNGRLVADPAHVDYERIPLGVSIDEYLGREVLPFLPDAYVDDTYRDKLDQGIGRVGYEVNFSRFFYQYIRPRDLHDIDQELKNVEREIAQLLGAVTE